MYSPSTTSIKIPKFECSKYSTNAEEIYLVNYRGEKELVCKCTNNPSVVIYYRKFKLHSAVCWIYPPNFHVYLEPQNLTFMENRVFVDITS